MKTLTLLVCLSGPLAAWAQSGSSISPSADSYLQFGLGTSLLGSGDYNVLKTQVEYGRALSRHFTLGGRLAVISGSQQIGPSSAPADLRLVQSYQAVNLEPELYLAPFGQDGRVVFQLGAGPVLGYTRQLGYSAVGYGLNQSGQMELSFRSRTQQGLTLGYLASLNLHVGLGQDRAWALGTRLALQNDTEANILPGAQLTLTRRL